MSVVRQQRHSQWLIGQYNILLPLLKFVSEFPQDIPGFLGYLWQLLNQIVVILLR